MLILKQRIRLKIMLALIALLPATKVFAQNLDVPRRTPAAELRDRTGASRVNRPGETGGPRMSTPPASRPPSRIEPNLSAQPLPPRGPAQSWPTTSTSPYPSMQPQPYWPQLHSGVVPVQRQPRSGAPFPGAAPWPDTRARAEAQSLRALPASAQFSRPRSAAELSLTYIPEDRPNTIKKHDIVFIVVKESSESTVESRFTRNRRGNFLAELAEFVRLNDRGNLVQSAANEPTIEGNLNSRLDANGRVQEREEIVYRIAATVVDVLPNGNVILEARKRVDSNGDSWEHTVNGMIRSIDIQPDNSILSEQIANLRVSKKQVGRVDTSTRRAWGTRLMDALFPF